MNPFKSKNTKRLILGLTLSFLVFIIIFLIENKRLYNNYKNEVNNVISGVVLEVKKSYPSVTEEALIRLFNNKSNYQRNNVLKAYGLNDDDISIINGLKDSYTKNVIIIILIFSILFILVVTLFIIYVIKEEKKLLALSNYANDVSLRKYNLKLDENEEGMLSKLQNDLYKLMITLREAYDNESKEKLQMKKSLEDISHQLKTPLTGLVITLDNLSNDNLDGDLRKSFLEDAKMQVDKMSFLIKSLLKLSRFDAGVIKFKSENILVGNLISDVLKSVNVLAEINDVRINVNIKNKTSFTGDYHWELEAVTNVVKNAIEHSKPGGIVEIKSKANGVYTLISVTNYGGVIGKQDLKNIFTRFYKGKDAAYESIGIGLSLSKSIIEKDGGYINVTSSKDNGTCFRIKYPKIK